MVIESSRAQLVLISFLVLLHVALKTIICISIFPAVFHSAVNLNIDLLANPSYSNRVLEWFLAELLKN